MTGGHRDSEGCCLAACPSGLWDTDTVAARTGLSTLMVRFLVTNRCIPHVACGDHVRFVPATIEAWAALCGHHLPDTDGPPIARRPDVHGADDSSSGSSPHDEDVGSGGLAEVYELDRYRQGRRTRP